jgi:hypothetical protein
MKKLLLALLVFGVPPAHAADGGVRAELNKLEQEEEACRAYLVLENATESAFEELKLDLVLFAPDGVVARRLAVEMAPLAAEKTSLKVFGIDGLACETIARVLLNDVLACADASGTRDDCLALVSPTARGAVPFFK